MTSDQPQMDFTFSIEGVEELAKLLDELPDQLDRRDVLKNALREGAQIIKDDAVAFCPVYEGPPHPGITPGLARDSIKVRMSTARGSGAVTARVQTGQGDFRGVTFYASFLEFGHALGKRTSWSKRGLQEKTSIAFLRQFVQPRPFLRPAFDRNKERVEFTIRQAVAAAIAQIGAAAGLAVDQNV